MKQNRKHLVRVCNQPTGRKGGRIIYSCFTSRRWSARLPRDKLENNLDQRHLAGSMHMIPSIQDGGQGRATVVDFHWKIPFHSTSSSEPTKNVVEFNLGASSWNFLPDTCILFTRGPARNKEACTSRRRLVASHLNPFSRCLETRRFAWNSGRSNDLLPPAEATLSTQVT